jgi:23S rRNA pseudouridine1911/1915/1917 synthase
VHHGLRGSAHRLVDLAGSSRPARPLAAHLNAHIVTADEAGVRCDLVIARLSGASRAVVAGAIRAGTVRLNGEIPKQSVPLAEGDALEYALPEPAHLEALPEDLPLDIVYEDEALLVVDKPAGMITHPAHAARDGTLVNALLAHAAGLPGDPLRAGLVHRLDRDTSGLLVVAKTEAALARLGKEMQRRAIEREYLGLVTGIPDHAKGTIDGALGRDPKNRLKYAVVAGGKPAVTHYEIREKLKGASELLFALETGRTHQIRVHMAAFGHALVNDPLYGRHEPRVDMPGQALHAWRLRFRHPVSGETLTFEAPPPPQYVAARDILRA